jgi:hypothetical protein
MDTSFNCMLLTQLVMDDFFPIGMGMVLDTGQMRLTIIYYSHILTALGRNTRSYGGYT